MLKAIRHGLGNLINFEGRDARQAFWYYMLFLYIVTLAITMVVTVPMMLQGFMTGIREGINASQSSDPVAAQAATQAAIANAMRGTISTSMWLGMVTGLLMLAGLAASFVRRLHDSGLSGFWALIPAAIQVGNLALAPMMVRQMMDNLTHTTPGDPTAGIQAMQGSVGAASLLGWAAIIAVVVLGVRKSTPGPNRYGEAPFVA
jgi:uncharacterized membrane protein YhaH (DUF805 family)